MGVVMLLKRFDFEYLGYHNFPSRCRVLIYEKKDKNTVIFLCELPHNPGTSVTNACEIIAGSLNSGYPEEVSRCAEWIEYYCPRNFTRENFSRILFPEILFQ